MTNHAEQKMTNFILDGFLEWLADECDQRQESYTICSTQDQFGRFEWVWVQTSWVAWQASRAALAVELPEAYATDADGHWLIRLAEVKKIIEAQGLKVTP